MNITKKNMTFTLAEESGGYSFNGDFVLGASGLAEFRGSVTPKAGGRMGSVYFNETGSGEVSVSFSGAREDFSEALAALGTLVGAAKEAINGTGAETDKPHTAGQPEAENDGGQAVPSGSGDEDGERQVGNDGSGDADSTLTGKQARLIEF